MCSSEARALMRQAAIAEEKIVRLCDLARRRAAAFAISVLRTENELGYCRVTLALANNSAEYLNQLALTSEQGLFEIFLFHNILPGATGYASAKSRILLGCDEAGEKGLFFHWPSSLRVGDRVPRGSQLERLKPLLTGRLLHWKH